MQVQELVSAIIALIILIFLWAIERVYAPAVRAGGSSGPLRISLRDTLDFLSSGAVDGVLKGTPTAITLADVRQTMQYAPCKTILRTTMHNGQIKLLITEIEFLTAQLAHHTDKAVVVYAGSAPSHKIPFLMRMFPQVQFILVDPNEHFFMNEPKNQYSSGEIDKYLYLAASPGSGPGYKKRKEYMRRYGLVPTINTTAGHKSRDECPPMPTDLAATITAARQRCVVIEALMTDDLARQLAPLSPYFISDIRTNSSNIASGDDDSPTDLDILWNSAMMYNWIAIMKPPQYMIKFRPTYPPQDANIDAARRDYERSPHIHPAMRACPIDLLGNFGLKKFIFLKGDIWLQAFAGENSSESRLVGSGRDLTTVEYNIDDYDNRFCYYNRIVRSYGYHKVSQPDICAGIDHCGDCALMCAVFDKYNAKYGQSACAADAVRSIGRSLLENAHGIYYKKITSREQLAAITKFGFAVANMRHDMQDKTTNVGLKHSHSASITTDHPSFRITDPSIADMGDEEVGPMPSGLLPVRPTPSRGTRTLLNCTGMSPVYAYYLFGRFHPHTWIVEENPIFDGWPGLTRRTLETSAGPRDFFVYQREGSN
jgi:hypothetical protein